MAILSSYSPTSFVGSQMRRLVSPMYDVRDHGIVGDGETNNSAALNELVVAVSTAGGGTIYVPNGVYMLNAQVNLANDVHFVGENKFNTIFRSSALPVDYMFRAVGHSRFSFRNFTFDANDYVYDIVLDFNTCTDWEVDNCRFIRMDYFVIFCAAATRFRWTNNYAKFTVMRNDNHNTFCCAPGPNNTVTRHGVISGNYSEHGQMTCDGIDLMITHNTVYNWAIGSAINIGFVENEDRLRNVIAYNNVRGAFGFDFNSTWCLGMEIWAPQTLILGNQISLCDGVGIELGGTDCIVANNIIESISQGNHTPFSAISVRYYDETRNPSGSIIVGNKFFHKASDVMRGKFAIADQADGGFTVNDIRDVKIFSNAVQGYLEGAYNISGDHTLIDGHYRPRTATVNPASVSSGAATTPATITVENAVLGDRVEATFSLPLQGLVLNAWVSAIDTVSYNFVNLTGGSVDLGSGVIEIRVFPKEQMTDGTDWRLANATFDMDFLNNRYLGKRPVSLTFSRASVGTDLFYNETTRTTYREWPSNVMRLVTGQGLLIEEGRTNYLLNSTAPATQTTGSLSTGTYTLWVIGGGTATVAAGTATISGGGSATSGTPLIFTVSGSGTVVVTVSGSLSFFQLEKGNGPTSFIPTAGTTVTRPNEIVRLSSTAFTDVFAASSAYTVVADCYFNMATNYGTSQYAFTISDGSTLDQRFSMFRNGTTGVMEVRITSGGASQWSTAESTAVARATATKVALSGVVGTGGGRASVGGRTAITGDVTTMPASLTTLTIGTSEQFNQQWMNGFMRRLTFMPVATAAASIDDLTA